MSYYVYRFLNKKEEIIYIGKTKYLNKRLSNQHFTEDGHLSKECYDSVKKIQYVNLEHKQNMNYTEYYLINKYKPKYNTIYKSNEVCVFDIDESNLKWKNYEKPDIKVKKQKDNLDSNYNNQNLKEYFKEVIGIYKEVIDIYKKQLKVKDQQIEDLLYDLKKLRENYALLQKKYYKEV